MVPLPHELRELTHGGRATRAEQARVFAGVLAELQARAAQAERAGQHARAAQLRAYAAIVRRVMAEFGL